ncbi:alanine--tRNA ligase-related protein [Candidatus Nardonella dryophthoridicola]|uniref:Alanine--tRNA ligase n=1 Tax=endosymbiont of Rhynchophorus ferrugineus TaxID=1972133 RepID=A0A2Z5T3W3_9GAMM|nr:alanine--tRNA ligase-related protein [Candidatus Nardonella dryophthoridicola]BBA85078.1 alanine--tRNA ligase [endosymbiont of Rhynchophorus ferrugineus]
MFLSDLRKLFINYFIENNHKYIKSSSIVSKYKDLLFVNSGMSVFKKLFYNNNNLNFVDIVSNQKCLRVNGKYNDINNIGFSDRHNTFFEMLGNFSFGNYFKEKSIYMSFKFLTDKNYLSIDINKIIITVYYEDYDSYNIWKKLGIKKYNIVKVGDKNNIKYNSDNFWNISYFGLCGPCTEIYYDFGDKYDGNFPGYGNVGDRYLEIWNLVFIQYIMNKDRNLLKLKYNSVDTGMGLERIVSVIQNVNSNYEIKLFKDLIDIIKIELYKINFSVTFVKNISNSFFKIISDHIRSSIFIINDGIFPSNKKHGYILRKIIRRSYYNLTSIGIKKPFLYKLINKFLLVLYDNYNDKSLLKNNNNINKNIEDIIFKEENNFINILNNGLLILKKECKTNNNFFSRETINKLYNTYGLPIKLILDFCKSNNINFEY